MHLKLFSILLVLLLVAVACTPQAIPSPTATLPPPASPTLTPAPTGLTVTDALGRTVHFDRLPQRIVLAGKALFMVADALYLFPEAGTRIAALGQTGQGSANFIPLIDPNFEQKISLGTDAGPEQIAAARPDCVILKSYLAEKLGKPLELLGIPVVYVDLETPDQYRRDLLTLGEILGDEARAQEVVAFYQERVERVSQALAGLAEEEKPRVLLVYYTDKDGTVAFNVPPMEWIQTWMIQAAGGRPVWGDAHPTGGWTKVGFEQIAAWDPDVVFVVAYFNPIDQVTKTLREDPQWKALRAVQEGRLYGFPDDVYSWDQPDPRWILGFTWVATKLHPERFQGMDILAEARTFYRQLYGMDEAAFEELIQPTLAGDLH